MCIWKFYFVLSKYMHLLICQIYEIMYKSLCIVKCKGKAMQFVPFILLFASCSGRFSLQQMSFLEKILSQLNQVVTIEFLPMLLSVKLLKTKMPWDASGFISSKSYSVEWLLPIWWQNSKHTVLLYIKMHTKYIQKQKWRNIIKHRHLLLN